jgi:hypothetical protein
LPWPISGAPAIADQVRDQGFSCNGSPTAEGLFSTRQRM